jgi:hypothetical protein
MNELVTLACPNCGAKLEITSDIDRFACSHCGQEHIVKRGGGIVSLSPVIIAINQVKLGVDKTAAELAIARIRKEIDELRLKRKKLEENNPEPSLLSSINGLQMGLIVVGIGCLLIALFTFNPDYLNEFFPLIAAGLVLIALGSYRLFSLKANKNSWQEKTGAKILSIQEEIKTKKSELEQLKGIVAK